MINSIDKELDLSISFYLNSAVSIIHNRNDAWMALAWSLFEEAGGKTHPYYDLIKSRLPKNALCSDLSIRNILKEEDLQYMLSNVIEVIDTVYKYYYSSLPFNVFNPDDEVMARFMAKIAAPKPNERIYLPFAGMTKVIEYLPNSAEIVKVEEKDPIIWSLTIIKNFFRGSIINLDAYSNEDSFETMETKIKKIEELERNTHDLFSQNSLDLAQEYESLYDLIIMCPSYYLETTKEPNDITFFKSINSALSVLKKQGRLIVVIPSVGLIKTRYTRFIFSLKNSIKTITEIFPKKDTNAKLFYDQPMVILEITKTPVDTIKLYDTNTICPDLNNLSGFKLDEAINQIINSDSSENEGVFRIKYSDIKDDNILRPSYVTEYNRRVKNPHITLRDCMTCIPTRPHKSTEKVPIIRIKDLSNNYLDCDIDLTKLSNLSKNRVPYKILTKSALLIGFPFHTGFTVGRIKLEEGQRVLLGINIIPFEIDSDKIIPDYLLKEITSKEFDKFYNFVNPSLISTNPQKFLDLIIPLPDLDTQNKIVLEDARNSISKKQAEILDLNAKYLTEIRLRKHTLITKMATFINYWESLYDLLRENDGKIDLKADGEWISKMGNYLKTINEQLCTLTETQEDFGDNSPIHPDKLIDAYCKTLIQRASNFNIRRERIKDSEVLICFPIRAFNRIMENIVNNAKSHGFTNPDRKDYAISIQTVSDGPFVYINVANNGHPLSEKITTEQVLMLGHSTQTYQNNHEGYGGYDIQHLMEMFDSEVSVISTPDLEYTVTYQLKFKKYESN